MQTISRLEEKDFTKYEKILSLFGIASGKEIDDGFKIFIDNKEYILFPFGPISMVYYEENGVVKSSIIQTDLNGKIKSFTLNNREIIVDNNGVNVIDEDHNQQSLYCIVNQSKNDPNVSNNGIISYLQYQSKDDVSLEMRYDHNFLNDCRMIYSYQASNPFYVSFKQKASKNKYSFLGVNRSYYRMDFDARNNKFMYDLATLSEYGLGAMISHGSIALHNSYSFSKYYRELLHFGEYASLLSFPFSKGYDSETIDEMISTLGFSKNAPQCLIDLYNNLPYLIKNRQRLLDIYSGYISGEILKKSK